MLGSLIVAQHPMHSTNLFIGEVQKYLSESSILLSLYNNKTYVEHNLNDQNVIGVMLLKKSFPWKYVNVEKFNNIIGNSDCKDCKNNPIHDTSLLTDKGDLTYDDLFGEKKINDQIYDGKHKFRPLSESTKKIIQARLNVSEEIPDIDKIIVVNKNIAVRNIIETKEDEVGEGNKIIDYVKTHIIDKNVNGIKLFADLKMTIFNGYVHFSRDGISANDVITKKLVPDLKYFNWQYGIPIDYDALKYVLFQNKFQHGLEQNMEEQKDAEKIFSQEYLISLQPEPQYLIWTLKRLLLAWYSDTDLERNIRKVKVLINQWRSRGDKNFNVKNGVLPSIVIYPKYGKDSAKIVLEKISHYFLLYQNNGWECSTPTYFIKVNNLIWYTNGNIDLKLYFKKTLKLYKGTTVNTSFDSYLSKLLVSHKLLK
jgi:hypothetical protein